MSTSIFIPKNYKYHIFIPLLYKNTKLLMKDESSYLIFEQIEYAMDDNFNILYEIIKGKI